MRTKLCLLLASSALVGAVAICCWQAGDSFAGPASEPPSFSAQEVREILAESQRLDDIVEGARRFHEEFQATVDELRLGRLSLAEATERILACAVRHHPAYLQSLSFQREAAGDRVNVARNLLFHLRLRQGATAQSARGMAILNRLQRELLSSQFNQPGGSRLSQQREWGRLGIIS